MSDSAILPAMDGLCGPGGYSQERLEEIKALATRYPEPAPKPTTYQGWRRDRKNDGFWQKVEGTEKPSKGQCYQSLMELSELVGGEQVQWEFAILPAGEKPAFASGRRNLS